MSSRSLLLLDSDWSGTADIWGGSDSDGVGVGVGGVADPALRRAGLDRHQAQEADLQPRHSELGQLEVQNDRTHLQHGGRGEAGDLQLTA